MSLIKNEFPLLSPSIMKGVMRHIKNAGLRTYRHCRTDGRNMLSAIAFGAGKSAFSEERLNFFFLKNAKPRKKRARLRKELKK